MQSLKVCIGIVSDGLTFETKHTYIGEGVMEVSQEVSEEACQKLIRCHSLSENLQHICNPSLRPLDPRPAGWSFSLYSASIAMQKASAVGAAQRPRIYRGKRSIILPRSPTPSQLLPCTKPWIAHSTKLNITLTNVSSSGSLESHIATAP